jgi:hypothetical protein
MGLLDGWPLGWFGLLGNGAQDQNGGIGADAANYLPPLAPQPRRLPLSFAGPAEGPALAASLPGRAQAQMSAGNPFAAYPDGIRAVPSLQSPPSRGSAQPLAPIAPNLTAQVLRAKGVPETDIAAAIGNPGLMKQLIYRNFGPGSAGTPAKVGYAAFSGNANGGPFGYADQRVDPGTNGLDDDRARHDPPAWNQFTQSTGSSAYGPLAFNFPNQTQPSISVTPTTPATAQPENSKPPIEDTPIHLAQVFAFPPVSFFARPPVYIPRQLTPLEKLPSGSAGGPNAGKPFARWMNRQQPDGVPCTYCGRPTKRTPGPDPERYNGDHIIPRTQGGNSDPANHTPACQACNLGKGDRTPAEWYRSMQRNPDDGNIGEDSL